MPRRPRIEHPGAIHHVFARGNNRKRIFLDDRDRIFHLRTLRAVSHTYEWHCLGYCLMDNHYHLIIETPKPTLGSGMRAFNGRYAQYFNRRHATGGGHVFQERYGGRMVTNDLQFAQLIRYVARNPVRAGLCADPGDWPWSNHRATVRNMHDPLVSPARLEASLEHFGGTAGTRYARLFDTAGPLAGIDPDVEPWNMRPDLGELLASAPTLDAGMREARAHGYRLAEIARAAGIHESTVSRRVRR